MQVWVEGWGGKGKDGLDRTVGPLSTRSVRQTSVAASSRRPWPTHARSSERAGRPRPVWDRDCPTSLASMLQFVRRTG
jgi:hypothetical protein